MHCIRCDFEKLQEEFAWRDKAKGKRLAHCRSCQAEYHRKHYAENRQKYIERAAARKRWMRDGNRERLLEFLSVKACADCGETDPVVLEFDHLRDKKFAISQALRFQSWTSIRHEIEKCEVVCANCHRRRTARRGMSLRLLLAESESENSSSGWRESDPRF